MPQQNLNEPSYSWICRLLIDNQYGLDCRLVGAGSGGQKL